MFNSGRNMQASNLNDLLANPNTTLVRLLDDENFISEFRSGSPLIKE
jgi:hypothetical protein